MGRSSRSGGAGVSSRETVFLLCILVIAGFFVYRISQLKGSSPESNTITAVLSTTQVLRRAGTGIDEPSVVTELVIDSTNARNRKATAQLPVSQKEEVPVDPLSLQGAGASAAKGRDSGLQGVDDAAARNVKLKKLIGSVKQADALGQDDAATGKLRTQGKGGKDTGLKKAVGGGGKLQELVKGRETAPTVAAKNPYAALPASFDWQTYLLYYPELRDAGINTEVQAKDHYLKVGRGEGRIYKRLRVLLRYTACTGLINQQYSHIAAFSLCAVLGAELVLPPAVKRDSFAHYFSVFKEHNEVTWTPAPLESLLNVDKIVAFWRSKGLTVHKTPALTPFPDLTLPEVAYPLYPQPEIDMKFVTYMKDVYLRNLDMPELVDKARQAVIGHAGKLLREDPNTDIQYIVLDLPCTFFMLRSLSNLRVVTEVARSLEFSPYIQGLADRVIHGMTRAGRDEYNAVHLRIEKDARDWSQIMGGEQVVWHGYIQSMRQCGFTAQLKLYAASGLLTYGANDDMDQIIKKLKDLGMCSEVHYKELYLPQNELEALNSEQKALVDFLVLSRGRGFVGFGSSTFSFYIREYRVLNGIPRSSSVLVDASVIGTDPLFNSAGTVV